MVKRIGLCLTALCLACPLTCVTGCGTELRMKALSSELADGAKAFTASALDQAIFDRLIGRLGGQAINPGAEVYAGIIYVAGGRLTGVSAQFGLEGDGHGAGELSPAARAAILKFVDGDESQREYVLKLLQAWREGKQAPEPEPPAPPPPAPETAAPPPADPADEPVSRADILEQRRIAVARNFDPYPPLP